MFVIAMILIIGGIIAYNIEANWISWFQCGGIVLITSSIPALLHEMMLP